MVTIKGAFSTSIDTPPWGMGCMLLHRSSISSDCRDRFFGLNE